MVWPSSNIYLPWLTLTLVCGHFDITSLLLFGMIHPLGHYVSLEVLQLCGFILMGFIPTLVCRLCGTAPGASPTPSFGVH